MTLELDNVSLLKADAVPLLDMVNLSLDAGITALVGANGAGKSTLLRAIVGLHPLHRGTIRFEGVDNHKNIRKFRRLLAFMPQNFTAFHELTGREFMHYVLRLRGAGRSAAAEAAEIWLGHVGLADAADQRTSCYSQGMLQKLGIACTLQVDVGLYVLDEPFAGVDPETRSELSDLLFTLLSRKQVIISTHHVDEMAARGARLARIADGTVVA